MKPVAFFHNVKLCYILIEVFHYFPNRKKVVFFKYTNDAQPSPDTPLKSAQVIGGWIIQI